MGYCKKWIFRNMLPWLIITLLLGVVSLSYAVRLPNIDRELNKLYEQQALEMELDKPQIVADSGDAIVIFIVVGIVFLLGTCFSLSKFLLPKTSRMGKSLLRYAKYENEGDFQELLSEVEADMSHAAVFGDIAIGENWIAGRSFPPGGQAVRLSRLCAAYYTVETVSHYSAGGAFISSKWYHIYLIDEKKRQTELLTPREADLMGAYRTLLLRNPSLLHGGEEEYYNFFDLPDDRQELLLNGVSRKTYEQKYYKRENDK